MCCDDSLSRRASCSFLGGVQHDAEYNMFVIEKQHSVQSESISNTCAVEKVDSNVISDSPDMCDNDIPIDQSTEECDVDAVSAAVSHSIARQLANLMYLKKAQSEKPCLYEIPYDNSDLANRFVPDREETLTLEKESRSKLNKDKYVESLENEIDELESDKVKISNMYDLLLQECVSKDVTYSYLHSLSEIDAHAELKCYMFINVKDVNGLAQKLFEGKLKLVTSNVNVVCATCGNCLVDSDPFACVTKLLNDMNARTKKLMMLYEKTNNAWKWWTEQQCPSGYKWVPKKKMKRVPKVKNDNMKKKVGFAIDNIVQLILFIVDSGCTKHMTGNLMLLCNFVEKYLGTVHFGNDQFAPILGYGDLVQGNITINRVYYVEGLNHILFSVGQFCVADLEAAFQKSTCFVRDLQGNDLLL
ncbi:hypothetical protein Tco_0483992 [Tanacetum coccineum]